jgi:hypothetical protein
MQLQNKMALLEETGLYGVLFHICWDDRTTHSKTGRLVTLDLYQQHTPVNLVLIQEKAISLHEALKEELGEEEGAEVKPFGASRGWFHHFQK